MPKLEMPKVVVVGGFNTNMSIRLTRIPKPGETVLGGAFHQTIGGKGANQALAAVRAGATVTLVACVGQDVFGEQALREMARHEIETAYIARTESMSSGVALILVEEGGGNSMAVAPGANAALHPEHMREAEEAIRSAEVLIMQLEIPVETVRVAAKIASAHDTKVILNPAPAQPLDSCLLQHVAVLTSNASDVEQLTGVELKTDSDLKTAADMLLSEGADAVLVTQGRRGTYMATRSEEKVIDGFKPEALRTMAAAEDTFSEDTFSGALGAALSEAFPLDEAITFANAAAALSVQRIGAQASIPNRGEIDALYQNPVKRDAAH